MKSARSFKEFEALNGISMEEVLTVFEAVSEAFPMIVAANLTKNTYTMIKDDGFLANDMPSSGKYDDLIDVGLENIHPNYQRAFLDNFSRERLLQMLGQGRKEVCVKLYQKGRGDYYQWVSTHVIRVKDKDGDVCHICINKVLDECSSCGEQQRVSIARALAKKPEILFLDEPTGALDEETGRKILDYIWKLKEKLGFTLIMVTHNQNIADMARTIIRVNSGKITQVVTNDQPQTAYEIGW